MTTLAGDCGNPGNIDGEMHSALFSNGIEDIACLANCTFLVTDPSSRSVRAIAPNETCAAQPEPPAAGELFSINDTCIASMIFQQCTFVLAPCDTQDELLSI